MKILFETLGTVLAFFFVIFLIQLISQPQVAQQEAITVIQTLANIYHAAVNAFK